MGLSISYRDYTQKTMCDVMKDKHNLYEALDIGNL